MSNHSQSILDRLSAAAKPGETWDFLVLAALEGNESLEAALTNEPTQPRHPERSEGPSHPERSEGSRHPEGAKPESHPEGAKRPKDPPGAYLKTIAVEGFRGIGPKAMLDLPPGPGLTLVVGRNGSGKSSFAEALELLLTGDTFRWKKRAKIASEFALEGERGSCTVWREWPEGMDDVAAAPTQVQIHGKPKTGPEALGWDAALATYRPFLSYNEL